MWARVQTKKKHIYGSVSFVGLPDLGPRSSGDLGSIPGYPSQMSAPQAMDMGDPSPGDLSHGDLHWQTQPLETQAPWAAFGTHTIDFFTFLYYKTHLRTVSTQA